MKNSNAPIYVSNHLKIKCYPICFEQCSLDRKICSGDRELSSGDRELGSGDREFGSMYRSWVV